MYRLLLSAALQPFKMLPEAIKYPLTRVGTSAIDAIVKVSDVRRLPCDRRQFETRG